MTKKTGFKKVYPYQGNILTLPVLSLDQASQWYAKHFGMTEIQRLDEPYPTVVLVRDGQQIGFAITEADPEQDGASILVENIEGIKEEFEGKGLDIGDFRIDERDGQKLKVFFVVAPDGLCYCFHEPIEE